MNNKERNKLENKIRQLESALHSSQERLKKEKKRNTLFSTSTKSLENKLYRSKRQTSQLKQDLRDASKKKQPSASFLSNP
jgi:predicted nuclease with TOPRIM domain